MKLRAPPDCSCICHDGETIVVAADGSIDLSEANLPHLTAHGILPWTDEVSDREPPKADGLDPESIAAMSRSDVLAALADRGLSGSPSSTTTALRHRLRGAAARPLDDR